MNRELETPVRVGLLMMMVAVAGISCSTTSSTDAPPLQPTIGAGVDLSSYQVATVVPFDATAVKVEEQAIGARFAADIAWRLQYGFVSLFREVRQGQPTGQTDELIITGVIRSFTRGLQNAWGWEFSGEVVLKDGASGRTLLTAPFKPSSVAGGPFPNHGADVDEMAAAKAIASTVAQAKDWSLPKK